MGDAIFQVESQRTLTIGCADNGDQKKRGDGAGSMEEAHRDGGRASDL